MSIVPKLNGAVELFTGYIGVIGSDHAYIHQGLAFTALIETPSASANYNVSFKTPEESVGKYIHWRPIGVTSSANYVSVSMYEGDTYTSGSAVTPVNRNRNSDAVTTMQAFARATTTTPSGTLLSVFGVGSSGNPSSRSGGGSGADEELLLKPDTIYTIEFDPAGTTIVTAQFFWYEEDRGV